MNENYIKSCFSSSRREIFKKILLDWLHQLHEDFLEKEGISKDLEEELKKEGVWHWKFDLEGVGEIPEGRLPDKPIAGRLFRVYNGFLVKNFN